MSPQERFTRCLTVTEGFEGGLARNPKDPGGLTYRGVTLPALSQFLGREAQPRELMHASDQLIGAVYHAVYWPAVGGDELPPGIDLILFDGAVHSGRRRSVSWVQAALGVTVDGAMGPVTLAAIHNADPIALVHGATEARRGFLRAAHEFATFGRGWLNRVDGITAKALSWVLLTEPST